MIKVRFFAGIREQLDTSELAVDSNQVNTLGELRAMLAHKNGELWSRVLMADNVIIARNQEVAQLDWQVADEDEVAFYPPVTGG
jgi:molybdopterin synthase sulfur carrier subunit